MSRELRRLAALALVGLISLIGAACGSNASSKTTGAGSSGSAGDASTAREKAVKFAECMRNNGVGDFPDPNAKGEFDYGVSVSPAVFKRAVTACKDLQPPGTLSSKRTPEQQSLGLQFAHCMREHGIRDFPDPINGEPLIDTTRIPSSEVSGGMTILNAAIQKCRSLLSRAAAGQ
jgi:hypothetical protein